MKSSFDRLYTVNIFKNINYNKGKEFQDIVELAAEICETPVALITLLDDEKNHFVAKVGVSLDFMPADTSFCRHTIQQDDVMVVNDALLDHRFADSPQVAGAPGVRFYAGTALRVNNGHRVGSLCVIDVQPKTLTAVQVKTLEVLSRQVTILMELELGQQLMRQQLADIEEQNRMLMNISRVQSHDFRAPVALMLGIMNIIKDEDYTAGKEYLQIMEGAVKELDEKIHLIVEYTQVL